MITIYYDYEIRATAMITIYDDYKIRASHDYYIRATT